MPDLTIYALVSWLKTKPSEKSVHWKCISPDEDDVQFQRAGLTRAFGPTGVFRGRFMDEGERVYKVGKFKLVGLVKNKKVR